MKRPFVLLKAATSLDGFLDDASAGRRVWSGPQDRQATLALRAEHDAILVGAETVRTDDPTLRLLDPALQAQRRQRGQGDEPRRLVLSARGDLPRSARLFAADAPAAWIFTAASHAARLQAELPSARVFALPEERDLLPALLAALVDAGINSLLVEGGARLHGAFLRAGAFDALRLALAPTWIERGRARLFAHAGAAPGGLGLSLKETKILDDLAVLHYVSRPKRGT